MFIKTYSYRFAEEILQHENHREAYEELIEICKNCPVPVYKGKSKNQKKLDVVQQIMNTYFLETFKMKAGKKSHLRHLIQMKMLLGLILEKYFIKTLRMVRLQYKSK